MTETATRPTVPRWPAVFPAAMPTPMLGRDRDATALTALVEAGTHRLITIVGTGGVGKTRLARHVARSLADPFEGRILWVDLDPVDDPGLLLPEMAAAMGVGEGPGADIIDRLHEALAEGRTLAVLDPVDRVAAAVAFLPALLERCPTLTILATGRTPLGIRPERTVMLDPLALPRDGASHDAIEASPAVTLFVDRLARVRPDLEPTGPTLGAIAGICRALDGLPLAIELAAASCRVIDPHQLLDRLAESISSLEATDPSALTRQRSLRATMDRSVELLAEDVGRMRRRLAVIAAPFHLDTATAVLDGGVRRGLAPIGMPVEDGLKALVEASLLRRVGGSGGRPHRYSMLRTVRADALDRLETSGEALAMRWAHAYHFLSVAEAAEAELPTERETQALDLLEQCHDDLRAALDWAIDREDGAFAVRLAGALADFWRTRGHHTEGRIRLQAAIAIEGGKPMHRRKALGGAGLLASYQGDYAFAHGLLEEALLLAREDGDQEAIAATLNWLGTNGYGAGHLDDAQAYIAEGLAIRRGIGDAGRIAVSLNAMGGILHFRGDLDEARKVFEESLALKVEQGNENAIAIALTNLGLVERDAGDTDRAATLFADAVSIWQRTGDKQRLSVGLHNAALADLDRGDLDTARAQLQQALGMARDLNDRPEVGYALTDLARVECAAAQLDEARQHLDEALHLTSTLKVRLIVTLALEATAGYLAASGDGIGAARLIGAADIDRERTGYVRMPADERLLDRSCAGAHATLGDDVWAAARTAGRSLELEGAIREAVGAVTEPRESIVAG